MKTGGFWTPGVTAFCDVRVTYVNSRSNQGKYTATIVKEQENEKKRKYNQKVKDVEMGTFTPLVFGTNGVMGLDCRNFLRTLANKLSTKNKKTLRQRYFLASNTAFICYITNCTQMRQRF